MVDDPTRSWIARRPNLTIYANGTRPFAYLALKRKLSCRELMLGLDEARVVARALDSGPGALPAEQIERVRALNDRVIEGLGAEQTDRCNVAVQSAG